MAKIKVGNQIQSGFLVVSSNFAAEQLKKMRTATDVYSEKVENLPAVHY